MKKLENHIFVCTNERPADDSRGCCSRKESQKLVDLFKTELKNRGLKGKVRAQKAGCLDVCEFGPTIVIYPEGVWYGKVEERDVPEIVEKHIIKGLRVERLLIPGKM